LAGKVTLLNYKHALHAGNHTEVFKHSVLSLLILALRKKPKPSPFWTLMAGAGRYDLLCAEAKRTGEARDGIGKIFDKDGSVAEPFLKVVRRSNPSGLRYYPGVARYCAEPASRK